MSQEEFIRDPKTGQRLLEESTYKDREKQFDNPIWKNWWENIQNIAPEGYFSRYAETVGSALDGQLVSPAAHQQVQTVEEAKAKCISINS